jgi:hypothetical protein
LPVTVISAKDRNYRPLAEIEGELRQRMLPALRGAVNADKTFVSV